MAKIKAITKDITEVESTIMQMMNVPRSKSLALETLMDGIMKMPFDVTIHYDKIWGLWFCSNQHEDDWPKEVGHKTSGPNFTFVEMTSEMALAKAIHYYFHTQEKTKE